MFELGAFGPKLWRTPPDEGAQVVVALHEAFIDDPTELVEFEATAPEQ